MRLRILELPTEPLGDREEGYYTPFVLVFDRVTMAQADMFRDTGAADSLKEATGARGLIISEDTIEL